MAVTLLRPADGTTSLEFDREDWPAVRAAIITRYGRLEVEKRATTNIIRFGGERFWSPVLEWEPNIFAESDKGAAMLEVVATAFGKDGEWIPTPVYDGSPTGSREA